MESKYNKFIITFLAKLDDGDVFKNIITLLFSISAYLLLFGGIYLTVNGILGSDGFITSNITVDNIAVGTAIGSSIGLLLGFLISLISVWILFSILKKRSEQLKEVEYTGLIDYVFNKTLPKLILVIGELVFILVFYGGILQIIASLAGSNVYAPLGGFPSIILNMLPGMDIFSQYTITQVYGDYDYFSELITMGISNVVASFIILIAFYIYKEIYVYLLKLATNFIGFLPNFAIKLAIRTKNEN